ncbi:hypothetical protein P1X15_13470 [Runella sp. MFBS21]|uniref:DUF922 domain-containing protein n=1 Tax=Runella sp. MFBS21 TaxID=3034018 RepID=UPI0023F7679D|nr:hypothetical protein [Runella sp. MFBS21]MDF7818619.1 hypothetical protein [Runella sp. MFBS21]
MQRSIFSVLLGFIVLQASYSAWTQTQTIALKPIRLNVQPKGFFILEVIDNRAITTNIGKIWSRPQPLTAQLQGGTANALESFLKKNFNPVNTDSLTPILLTINELRISETLTPENRVKGEVKMILGYETYREGRRVLLTNGNAATTYTRAGVVPEEMIESVIRKLLENELKGFNNWFAKGIKTSDLLAREVKLILEEETLIDHGDTLYYHAKRPLNWSDFQGAPSVLSRWAAQVFTSFGFEARTVVANRVIELYVRPKIWIDKTISWVRPGSKNDYVLDHEQLHFDITRLAAERFKRYLQKMTFSVEDFSSELQYQYIDFYRVHSQLQIQYDNETGHGTNQAAQAAWVKKVRDELRSYGVTPARP